MPNDIFFLESCLFTLGHFVISLNPERSTIPNPIPRKAPDHRHTGQYRWPVYKNICAKNTELSKVKLPYVNYTVLMIMHLCGRMYNTWFDHLSSDPLNFIAWWKSDLRRRFLSLLFWRSVSLSCMYRCENNKRKRHWIIMAVIDRIESFYSTTRACIQISGRRRNRDMNYIMPERRYVTRSRCYLTLPVFFILLWMHQEGSSTR